MCHSDPGECSGSQKLLYCGSADGCPYARHNLQYTEGPVKKSAGATHDFSSCVVAGDALCTAALQAACAPAQATSADACKACAQQVNDSGSHCTAALVAAFCAADLTAADSTATHRMLDDIVL